MSVVPLHRRLTCTHVLALGEERPEVPPDTSLRGRLVRRTGILGDEHAHDPDASVHLDHPDEVVDGHLRVFLAAVVVCLPPDRLDPAVDALTPSGVHYLVDGIALGEVDRCAVDLADQVEAVCMLSTTNTSRGTTQPSGVRGHQPHRPAAHDGDAVARREAGQFDAVPPRWGRCPRAW